MKANVTNDRLVPVEVAGISCYLNLSLSAVKQMMKDEDLKDLDGSDDAPEGSDDALLDMEVFGRMIAILLNGGSDYMNSRARIFGEEPKYPIFEAQDVMNLLDTNQIEELLPLVTKAMALGKEQEVAVKPVKGKNAKATQGQK